MAANTSYTNASNNLYAALCSSTSTGAPAASLTAVTRVFQYEPKMGNLVKPISVTIMPNGISETDWKFTLRIYSSLEENPQLGSTGLVLAIDQVDQCLKAASIDAGPSKFDTGFVQGIDVMVAKADVLMGREDGF